MLTYVFIFLESRYCPHGYTKCQGATAIRHCIRSTWLCDGDNDCGNNWDESLETCGKSEYFSLTASFIVLVNSYKSTKSL